MTPVESCGGCGGLFPFLPRGMCAACLDQREQLYQQVREWLLDNRGASVPGASAATGVEEALIMEFIRDGRLEFVGAEAATTPAEEELKERIRRDLSARGFDGAPSGAAPAPTGPVRLGMRSRAS